MEIKVERPPAKIWDAVHLKFEINDRETVFTYGDTLYNPGNIPVDRYLHAHEDCHRQQQAEFDGGKDAWWEQYLGNVEFRRIQEIEAYATQYAKYCEDFRDRNYRARYLHELASLLSSPMYKCEVNMQNARKLIQETAGV